jgi:hypothetical protein
MTYPKGYLSLVSIGSKRVGSSNKGRVQSMSVQLRNAACLLALAVSPLPSPKPAGKQHRIHGREATLKQGTVEAVAGNKVV